ncbi:putative tail tube protein [Acinetobacter phage BS46]|nr:putative tail tube protein [Acinetobacter phage BS46]
MLTIDQIVRVVISRETSTKTVRDLQKIAILSEHTRFAEAYRRYQSTTAMLADGFLTTDFAYIAAQRIFSQNPQVREVIVGKIVDGGTGVDYVSEITKLQAEVNDWFFLITDATDDADKIAIATYIETQTAIYVFSDHNTATLTSATTDIFSVLKEQSLMQSIGIYVKDTAVVAAEAALVGKFAVDIIGSNLWLHKTLTTLTPENFGPTQVGYLNSKNALYYTKVGEDLVVEGMANVVGGEKIHVILGSIWLEVRIGEAFWNLLYTKNRILYTNGGIDQFKAVLVRILNEAVDNNILTDDTPFQISVPDANKLTSAERASGILSKITFRARLAGAIIFVDAVEGTVYA